MTRIVAIGGGTGMPILIRSLLNLVDSVDAVVTVADDGGSSGVLRGEFGVLPPGDSRNCLVAMAPPSPVADLFQFRFDRGQGLRGHALGNLIIAALAERAPDFYSALEAAGALIGARGRVLPPALVPLTLYADLIGGGRVYGQCNVANRLRPLERIGLEPADAPACPQTIAAIEEAELLVLGPGSLFTSIIANLLVPEVSQAVNRSRAKKVFLCNLTVQPGETDGLTAADHLASLQEIAGRAVVDTVVTGNTDLDESVLACLRAAKSAPLPVDPEAFAALGVAHTACDLADIAFPTHHDPVKVTALFSKLLSE